MKKYQSVILALYVSFVTLFLAAFFIPKIQNLPETIELFGVQFGLYFFLSGMMMAVLSVFVTIIIYELWRRNR